MHPYHETPLDNEKGTKKNVFLHPLGQISKKMYWGKKASLKDYMLDDFICILFSKEWNDKDIKIRCC